MFNRDIFAKMGGGTQLFFLISHAFIGLLVASLLFIVIMRITGVSIEESQQSVVLQKVYQTIATLLLFVIPAILVSSLFYRRPISFLQLDNRPPLLLYVLVALLIIVIQPFINLLSELNQQMVLPHSMAAIEEWMKSSEESATRMTEMMISSKTAGSYLSNILIIAVLAGIAEELFFRGCMQQFINKTVLNRHVAIWLTAFIFSAIHFQFYGFIPRLLLGAILGYLFVWSGSLWIPIAAHIAHNGINIITMQYYYKMPQYKTLENYSMIDNWWIALISFILSILVIYMISKKRIVYPNKNYDENL